MKLLMAKIILLSKSLNIVAAMYNNVCDAYDEFERLQLT